MFQKKDYEVRESLARGMRSFCMRRDQAVRRAITTLNVARYDKNLKRGKTNPSLNIMRGRRLTFHVRLRYSLNLTLRDKCEASGLFIPILPHIILFTSLCGKTKPLHYI